MLKLTWKLLLHPGLKLHPAVPQGTPLPVQYPPSLGRSSGQPHGVLTPAAQVDSPKQGGSYFFSDHPTGSPGAWTLGQGSHPVPGLLAKPWPGLKTPILPGTPGS